MSLRTFSLGDRTSAVNGSAVYCGDLSPYSPQPYVSITGTFVGTWRVMVSFDGGTSFVQFDTGTAAKLVGPLPPCTHVRLDCTAFTSGTIEGRGGGQDPNRLA